MTMLLLRIAQLFVVFVALWIWTYMSFGNGHFLQPWYRSTGHLFSSDGLNGALCLHMSLPVLSAAALSTLIATGRRSAAFWWLHPRILTIVWVLASTVLYLFTQNLRKLHFENQYGDPNIRYMHIANSCGLAAMLGFGYLLIPVAKQNPIWKLFGMDEIVLLQCIHIWAGRVVVLGGTLHGAIHMMRWRYYFVESIRLKLSVPKTCWTTYKCEEVHLGCDCDDHFRNVTGFVAALCMLLLAITSLCSIRRRFYSLFYRMHALLGPASILFMLAHYNRAFMFLAPSLLYYLITSVCSYIESTSHVSILSVQRLGSHNEKRPCIVVTVSAADDAVEAYRAGQYIRLWCRSISGVSHPFTVNRVPKQPRQMRIIFRVCGKFTYMLSDTLQKGQSRIGIRGYLGTPTRLLTILNHDAVLLVAGGIGITPYLTLLYDVRDAASTTTKHVTLLWVCRDSALIRHVYDEYLEPLQSMSTVSGLILTVVLYNTFTTHLLQMTEEEEERAVMVRGEDGDAIEEEIDEEPEEEVDNEVILHGKETTGHPFFHSQLAGGNDSVKENLLGFALFTVVSSVGLWGLLQVGEVYPPNHKVIPRLWFVGLYLATAVVTAVWAKVATCFMRGRTFSGAQFSLINNEVDDLEAVEMEEVNKQPTTVTNVRCEELVGRPDLSKVLYETLIHKKDCTKLAVLQCGPKSLMADVREAVDWLNNQCSKCCARPRVALFEETFEI